MHSIWKRLVLAILLISVWFLFIMCGAYHTIKVINNFEDTLKQNHDQTLEW